MLLRSSETNQPSLPVLCVTRGLDRRKPVLGKVAREREREGSFYSDGGVVVRILALLYRVTQCILIKYVQ